MTLPRPLTQDSAYWIASSNQRPVPTDAAEGQIISEEIGTGGTGWITVAFPDRIEFMCQEFDNGAGGMFLSERISISQDGTYKNYDDTAHEANILALAKPKHAWTYGVNPVLSDFSTSYGSLDSIYNPVTKEVVLQGLAKYNGTAAAVKYQVLGQLNSDRLPLKQEVFSCTVAGGTARIDIDTTGRIIFNEGTLLPGQYLSLNGIRYFAK